MRGRGAPLSRGVGGWGSLVTTAAFALYNGALGVAHASLWHGSICLYYGLLAALRGILLMAERREGEISGGRRRGIFYGTWGLTLVMNAALTVPAALMVLSRRPVSMGLIPAIASATYTTYKVTAAIAGLRKKNWSVFARELGILRFDDALASVLVLQNTLITVMESEVSGDMFYLSAITSGGIFLLLFGGSLFWLWKGRKSLEKI